MRHVLLTLALLFCIGTLTGCDPVMPSDNIEAVFTQKPLIQGASADVDILYPDTDDTAIVGWSGQSVEILEGEDVVEVSGLTITALKPGNATLEVKVEAHCAFMGFVIDKPVMTTVFKVKVFAENEINIDEKHTMDSSFIRDDVSHEQLKAVTEFLLKKFGQYDTNTGFEYIFEIAGSIDIDKEKFYVGRWRWLVEDENGQVNHSSLITEFIINEAKTTMYEVWFPNANTLEWFSHNLL